MKKDKQTALNRQMKPLKFDVEDSLMLGNNKYELRVFANGSRAIWNYSERMKMWSPYSRTRIDERWATLKNESGSAKD